MPDLRPTRLRTKKTCSIKSYRHKILRSREELRNPKNLTNGNRLQIFVKTIISLKRVFANQAKTDYFTSLFGMSNIRYLIHYSLYIVEKCAVC